jgi:hypothetical protein
MLAAYKSVIPDKNAIYCSGAITSGRRAITWLANNRLSGYEADHIPSELYKSFQAEVVEDNIRELRTAAMSLRSISFRPVIDPSALPHVNGWTQENWRHFWASVISTFVSEIVLLDGWQFSRGACYELLIGLQKGVPVRQYQEEFKLDLERGRNMILEAILEIEVLGIDVAFHRQVLTQLDKMLVPI